ncbi:2-C-methyl-D-erythritol 4-phosphate cytidylyltransferase [Jeotgalibacillus proteolyticus]|uniref:2-C-methyl-D-erythritol 4-phosphate cytidylyltransferase n=1 Tax=Jeotgalibacillus proteolyticus TaxID=2082395 RepID=A0A2S5G6H6_9BACL|nr:2-C-methyl-D-erythritol 4-phosphate cytidylyltransferase [Jeotgalibacillus proteolyticus]PPA68580.1 2-C-methyl-D-erythritol 4-phosphate cytidylyltransferase [Jeotgalibacillus proteolyticus]
MKYEVVIPAAGQGKRMGAGRNKLFIEVDNKPIIVHTLLVFEQDPLCQGILLAINPDDRSELTGLLKAYQIKKVTALVDGGRERQQSVHNALKQAQASIVMVHDGARPFIQQPTILELAQQAHKMGGAVAAVPVKDTIKKIRDGFVEETIERASLWLIQTPQAFRLSIIMKAYEEAQKAGFEGTDDASLVEHIGEKVQVVEADYDNIKLTTKEDLIFAEAILAKRRKYGQ